MHFILKSIGLCTIAFFSTLYANSVENELAQGIATFTFDDGYICHREVVLPLLEKYGLSATFYVSSGFLGREGYLCAEQLIDLSLRGQEIASHGVSHRNLKQLPLCEVREELVKSKEALEELIRSPVENFAPPFGALHGPLLCLIKRYYRSCRLIFPGFNEPGRGDCSMIRAYVVLNSTQMSEVEAWVKRAVDEKKWLVLIYHRVDESQGIVSISPEVFENHLQIVKNASLRIMSVKEALEKIQIESR